MIRAEKEVLVSELNSTLKDTNAIVVANYAGVSAPEMEKIRGKMRAEGVTLRVVKNKLMKLALKDSGQSLDEAILVKQNIYAFSSESVAPAKAMVDCAKEYESFEVVGGSLGDKELDTAQVVALSKVPSLDESRSKIIGLLGAPGSKLARLVNEPGARLARVISAKAKQG